jgi:anti-sigma B factor antagonist
MKSDHSSGKNGTALAGASESRVTPLKKAALSLEFEHFGGTMVLHCRGRIVFRSKVHALSTVVAEVLPSARRLVVDLEGIDSIDSGGLGELVLTHLWAEAAGYGLKFAHPRKSVRHLFEITNLDSVFDVYASVPEAMAAMRQEEIHTV